LNLHHYIDFIKQVSLPQNLYQTYQYFLIQHEMMLKITRKT